MCSTFPDRKFVQSLLRELLIARADDPRDDIIIALATKSIGGQRLGLEVQVGMISAAIFGGFGTVISGTLSSLLWLEDHPEMHAALLDDDALMDRFIDEMLRLFPPNHGTARTAARDIEMYGQTLRRGDRVMMSWVAGDRDPAKFEEPSEARFGRAKGRDHLSFGGGPHRCLGAPMARIEMRHMIRAVLRRMPAFRTQRDRMAYYSSFAGHAGLVHMPVRFSPVRAS